MVLEHSVFHIPIPCTLSQEIRIEGYRHYLWHYFSGAQCVLRVPEKTPNKKP